MQLIYSSAISLFFSLGLCLCLSSPATSLPPYHLFKRYGFNLHSSLSMYSIIKLGAEITVAQHTDGPTSVEEMDSRQPNQNISYKLQYYDKFCKRNKQQFARK